MNLVYTQLKKGNHRLRLYSSYKSKHQFVLHECKNGSHRSVSHESKRWPLFWLTLKSKEVETSLVLHEVEKSYTQSNLNESRNR